jgi:hypothetical protein
MLTRVDPVVSLYRTEERYDYPIYGSKCGYTGTGSTGVSKHYITEFKLSNMNIALIGAHFVAIPTDSSRCAQREGQASVLQPVISNYVSKGYEVILIGDLNDFDGVVLDVNSNKPTSQVLSILKGDFGEYKGKYELTTLDVVPANTKPEFELYWRLMGQELKPDNIIIKKRVLRQEFR